MKNDENHNKKAESQEHKRFLKVTAKLDAVSQKGWKLSQEKISEMTVTVMKELGYVRGQVQPKKTTNTL